jgi:hypothetical protein
MKTLSLSILWMATATAIGMAEPEVTTDDVAAKHHEGAAKVAEEQDELSADVQQLTVEETVPQVIELLQQVESIMDEATDWLMEPDTGGKTIAAQTEIIEKIHAAAKERQKQQGSGQAGGAMMDMMERMMGKEPGQQPGPKAGEPGGDQPGTGLKGGASDTANDVVNGSANEKMEGRRVPKAAGTAGKALPAEFQKALDAFNRGAEQKSK